MITIKQAEFKGAFVELKQLPVVNLPEIALVGKSNVGKSSLLNKVVNRKKLAKSSSTPGKTRTINMYLINNSFCFIDLPGYGFAKVPQSERARWQKMIEKYLTGRKQLKGVIHLIDIRHPPGENDVLMKEWLTHYELPVLMVATKADKISRGARQKHLTQIRKTLGLLPGDVLIPFSAETGEGVEEIHNALEELLCL